MSDLNNASAMSPKLNSTQSSSSEIFSGLRTDKNPFRSETPEKLQLPIARRKCRNRATSIPGFEIPAILSFLKFSRSPQVLKNLIAAADVIPVFLKMNRVCFIRSHVCKLHVFEEMPLDLPQCRPTLRMQVTGTATGHLKSRILAALENVERPFKPEKISRAKSAGNIRNRCRPRIRRPNRQSLWFCCACGQNAAVALVVPIE